MNKALTITSFYLVIMLSVYMINVYGLGDDDGKFTTTPSISKDGCQTLKHKLHSLTDISIDDDNKTNITKKSQDILNILHDYISECDK